MSTPNLSISVEPNQGGKATYLPLVAPTLGEVPKGKIVLQITITNPGPSAITITGISYAFPGSSTAAIDMQGVDAYFTTYYKDSGGATLSPGQTKVWSNGLVTLVPSDSSTQVNNAIFLAEPIPATIEARITCAGFTAPAAVALPLVAHKSPTPQGAYLFPYSASDLRVAEYYVGSGVHWANGGASGTQIFAHDLGCEGFAPATQTWSRLLPGKSGSANPDYRIYGKPIRALADGQVLAWHDGMDENTVLGQFPTPTPSPGTGNSMTIAHGDEKVTYCHMQKGSLPAALKVAGAKVLAGQMIGLVGNTGNATEPHTHIEAEGNSAASPPRPFPFHDAYALSQNMFHPPDPTGPWSKLSGRGLSKEKVAVWPAPTAPAWYPPGWGEISQFGVPEASYQTIFNRATSSGYRPVWLDGYEVGGQTFFNVIFHPSIGPAWLARHGMTAAAYQTEFDTNTKAGYRLTNLTIYVSGGAVTYAAIFDKITGPAWRAYHGVSAESHQQSFDAFTKDGLRPVNVSFTATGGQVLVAAFYVQQDVGSFVHLGGLTSADYQAAWNTHVAACRQLAYLSAYQQGTGMRFSAIFQDKVPGSGGTVGRHDLLAADLQAEYDKELGAGLLTRVLVGYELGGVARFARAWRKP